MSEDKMAELFRVLQVCQLNARAFPGAVRRWGVNGRGSGSTLPLSTSSSYALSVVLSPCLCHVVPCLNLESGSPPQARNGSIYCARAAGVWAAPPRSSRLFCLTLTNFSITSLSDGDLVSTQAIEDRVRALDPLGCYPAAGIDSLTLIARRVVLSWTVRIGCASTSVKCAHVRRGRSVSGGGRRKGSCTCISFRSPPLRPRVGVTAGGYDDCK